MKIPPRLRRLVEPSRIGGTEIAGKARELWAKATPPLRPLVRFAGSTRLMSWLLAPLLAASIAASLLPAGSSATASRVPRHHTIVPAAVSAGLVPLGPHETPLQSLPHSHSATVGTAPFSARPPKHVTRGFALSGSYAAMPPVALSAYQTAQIELFRTDPSCHLAWEDVAGIGRVESDNGQTWGAAARVTANGTLFPPIYGPPLNGQNGNESMPVPHGGWVRAEGPMQFLPATWAEYAQDANGDGQRNPQNFYDAALTTGVFLCTNGGNMNSHADLTAAVLAYNHSDAYVALVESWITFYRRVGVAALSTSGSGLIPVGTPSTKPAERHPGTPPSPATVLADAALASQATGSYSFSLQALLGTAGVATGTGAVDTRNLTASLVLQLPGSGSLQVLVIGGQTYLSLPPALASAVGAEGHWILMTDTALSRLPAPFATGLSLAADDLTWVLGQLAGATDVHVGGRARINGSVATEYGGQASLPLAVSHLAGSAGDLGRVAALVGSSELGATAMVSGDRIQSAVLSLGSLAAGGSPLSLKLVFTGYGRAVIVTAPAVSPISSPTTTTTTTTTTTSTTSPGGS